MPLATGAPGHRCPWPQQQGSPHFPPGLPGSPWKMLRHQRPIDGVQLQKLWLLEYSGCPLEVVRYHFKPLLTTLIHLLSTGVPNKPRAVVWLPALHWQKPTP